MTVAPSKPNVVYAFIEAVPPKNGLYRSDDGGETWQLRDRSQKMIWRPFYFANLIVDPKNENKVYKPDAGAHRQHRRRQQLQRHRRRRARRLPRCLGRSRATPTTSSRATTAASGTRTTAATSWWKAENLPISQFYHVSVDMDKPYHVYGGLQDNSSWVGDSQYPGGITNAQWENMYGGDGFWMFVDPTDPTYIYAESQGGEIGRVNRKTHEIARHQAAPAVRRREAALQLEHADPREPDAERHDLHRRAVPVPLRATTGRRGSASRRTSRRTIRRSRSRSSPAASPWTTPSAEMHTTIYAIARIAEGLERHLGRHRRRQPAAHARRRQDLDERRRQHPRAAEERLGLVHRSRATSTRAPSTPRSTCTRSATCGRTSTARPTTARRGRRSLAADGPVRGYAHVIKEDLVNPRPPLPRHGVRALGLARRRAAVGAVQGRRTCRASPCATSRSIRATTTWWSPRTAAASGSSTTSRRCAR